ncbi:hypothetical protein ND16A_0023 [Thalassotalea sp. ND16A]|nr:hypothetical protein ND16A_0023 [Thalassotalea sp. ND16A]
MLMVIFSPLAIDIFLPALPTMANDLATTLTTMQWSISIFLLSMGIGQLFTGPLTDKYGRKPVALFGVFIYGLAALLSVFANTIELHLLARLAQGFGTCAIVVAAFSIVRDKFDPVQSGIMYSYLNGVICCIPALAPILGGWLSQVYGWHSTFIFMFGFAVIAGMLLFYLLKETNNAKNKKQINPFAIHRYKSIIINPIFQFHSVLVMLSMAVIIAYVSSSPAWLMVNLALTANDFIFWFSLNAIINIIACVTAPKVLTKYGASRTITMGMVTLVSGGVMMLVLQSWQTPFTFMFPVMFSSIGFSFVMGTCAGQALAPFGDKAGTASALLGFIQMSGSAVIVGLVQLLPINISEQIALLMLSILPLLVIWFVPRVKNVIM